MIMIIIIKL